MSLLGYYGAGYLSCCNGRGRHAFDCADAADHAREMAGESRCEGCGDWFEGAECPACAAYEAEEAAWEARQARVGAIEGRP